MEIVGNFCSSSASALHFLLLSPPSSRWRRRCQRWSPVLLCGVRSEEQKKYTFGISGKTVGPLNNASFVEDLPNICTIIIVFFRLLPSRGTEDGVANDDLLLLLIAIRKVLAVLGVGNRLLLMLETSNFLISPNIINFWPILRCRHFLLFCLLRSESPIAWINQNWIGASSRGTAWDRLNLGSNER